MKYDKEIFKVVEAIKQKSSEYVGICSTSNPMAYTDRLIEEILVKAKELNALYDQNTSDSAPNRCHAEIKSALTSKITNKYRSL